MKGSYFQKKKNYQKWIIVIRGNKQTNAYYIITILLSNVLIDWARVIMLMLAIGNYPVPVSWEQKCVIDVAQSKKIVQRVKKERHKNNKKERKRRQNLCDSAYVHDCMDREREREL